MSSQRAFNPAVAAASAGQGAPPAQDLSQFSPETLQRLVDQVAAFNIHVSPGSRRANAINARGGSSAVIGFGANEVVRRFDIEIALPSAEDGVRALNAACEPLGRVDLCWMMIPHDFMALPGLAPPATAFDPTRSQRFIMSEMTFTFGDGRDGFRSFGTGRTFPMYVEGRPRLAVAAIGNVTEGLGRFRGHEGNITVSGELDPERGFVGHVLIRILDREGHLRVAGPLPPPRETADPEPGVSYLLWAAQKGAGAEQENRPSLTPDGQVRGLNIPLRLKRLRIDAAAREGEGLRSSELSVGEVIGLEVGFGRGSQQDAPQTGTPLSPFQFEGVARYSFDDERGKTLGALTTNVLEGRRFDMTLTGLPGETAWRFGFFGPIVYGSGCFHDVQGMFYGASGSFFQPPPGLHVITHLYVARLYDPGGRFRAARR